MALNFGSLVSVSTESPATYRLIKPKKLECKLTDANKKKQHTHERNRITVCVSELENESEVALCN